MLIKRLVNTGTLKGETYYEGTQIYIWLFPTGQKLIVGCLIDREPMLANVNLCISDLSQISLTTGGGGKPFFLRWAKLHREFEKSRKLKQHLK